MDTKIEIKNLEHAKVGDKFMVPKMLGWKHEAYYGLAECTKVTPAQVIIGGHAYRKKDAREIGRDKYYSTTLYEVDQKLIAAGRIVRARHSLANSVNWDGLADEEIAAVWAIVVKGGKVHG